MISTISSVSSAERLPLLIERIVDTYAEVGNVDHLGHYPLPNYEAVVSIVDDLKAVLFPGYRYHDGLRSTNLTYHIGNLVDGLQGKLATQIARALRHEATGPTSRIPESWAESEARGTATAMAFLGKRSPVPLGISSAPRQFGV